MSKNEDQRASKRVGSDITTIAKSRLDSMLLARRSSSDIRMRSSGPECSSSLHSAEAKGTTRVKVRMTKAQLTKFMAESNNSSETAEKILDFYLHDGEAKKNALTVENITEKQPLESISDACKKTL